MSELSILKSFSVPLNEKEVQDFINVPVLMYGRSRSQGMDRKVEFNLEVNGLPTYFSRDVTEDELIFGEALDAYFPLRA